MAKKMCKCAICGVEFDRNAIQAVKHGARRYSHQTCEPDGELVPMEGEANDPELQKLKDYIGTLFGENTNWAMTNKYIKKFKKENGYSFSGMLKSLIYFYEVKGNSIDKANGSVGIIPYVYQDAYNYYLSIFMAQQNNESKTLFNEVKEFIIKPKKPKGTINRILEWEFDDEEE